jgi:hypothetical protein
MNKSQRHTNSFKNEIWGGNKERVKEGECGRSIIVYSCMKQKNETCWNYSRNKGVKESDGGSKFNYNML